MGVDDGLASPSLGLATVCLRLASGTWKVVTHQRGILAPLALHSDEEILRSHPGDTTSRPVFPQPHIIRSSPGPLRQNLGPQLETVCQRPLDISWQMETRNWVCGVQDQGQPPSLLGQKGIERDFPGGPVAKTPCPLNAEARGSIPAGELDPTCCN